MNFVTLKPTKERSLLRRHPWVYSNAIDHVQGQPVSGATVIVRSHDGQFLARAAYSPHSAIRARAWSFDESEPIDHSFFKRRIQNAIAHRTALLTGIGGETGATRLIFGEADGLPGLVVDYYQPAAGLDAAQASSLEPHAQLVCQFMSAGVERWKSAIVDALVQATGCAHVFERSDVSVRAKEGLEQVTGVLTGAAPSTSLIVDENGVRYHVDVLHGHKTGFYIDQRDNRGLVRQYSAGREVLNCFCYTGGFSLAALKGGATRVVSIDSSGEALALAERNMIANGFETTRAQWLDADAFKTLRQMVQAGQRFDLVVLDPPKFAPSREHIDRAARAYKDINLSAFKLLRPGGLLFTYSCSGAIDSDLFEKIVAGAALDAGVEARVLKRLGAGIDHPRLTSFPEGEYLKGLLLQRP
jgi:23S rRNA (cytosine1962-C5)-methyltransferase